MLILKILLKIKTCVNKNCDLVLEIGISNFDLTIG